MSTGVISEPSEISPYAARRVEDLLDSIDRIMRVEAARIKADRINEGKDASVHTILPLKQRQRVSRWVA